MGVPPDALMGHPTDRDCNVRVYSNKDRIVKKKEVHLSLPVTLQPAQLTLKVCNRFALMHS